MRKSWLHLAPTDARAVYDAVDVVQVALSTPQGPLVRTVHGAVVGQNLYWHGSVAGAKAQFAGESVRITAERTFAQIPSYWVDAQLACPATTYYESATTVSQCRVVEEPEEKAKGLQALMQRFQAEGGHEPIVADERYEKALRGVRVLTASLKSAEGRRSVGQMRKPHERTNILEQLWLRGRTSDLETIELMRRLYPEDPTPKFLESPYRLHVSGGTLAADQAAAALVDAYWNKASSLDELRTAHIESQAWVWAEHAGELVATSRAISDGSKHAWIYDVLVQPEFRGQGLARAMMKTLLAHPRVRSARRLHLGTRDAHFLYEPLGFRVKNVTSFDHMEFERPV